MASGMFSRGKDRTASDAAESIEDQIAELREQISALVKAVARDASDSADDARGRFSAFRRRAEEARDDAAADLDELIVSGEEILAELSGKYRDASHEVRRTVREHPLATLGAAALAGFVIAAILRR